MFTTVWFIVSIILSFKLTAKSDKKSGYSTLEYFGFWLLMHICTFWIPVIILTAGLGLDL